MKTTPILLIMPLIVSARAAEMADRFIDRPQVSGSVETLLADTSAATLDPGEDRDMHGGFSGRTAWTEWVAPANGWVTIDTAGSFQRAIFAVYSGNSLTDLDAVARGAFVDTRTPSSARFPVAAGAVYQIVLDGSRNYSTSSGAGRVNLRLDTSGGVASFVGVDRFADRVRMSGYEAYGVSNNEEASLDPFQPIHTGSSKSDVWWEWIAPATGRVTIDTLECDVNTILAVYSGSPVTGRPWDEMDMVARNDDVLNNKSSRVVFQTEAGRTYQIGVGGYGPAGAASRGNVVLHLALEKNDAPGAVPGTDKFIHRPDLMGLSAAGVACNSYASVDPFEEVPRGDKKRSVWWRWVAPKDCRIVLDTRCSEFDTTLRVYRGDDLRTLQPVADNDDVPGAKWSKLVFDARKGAAYQIRVDSGYSHGNIALHLNRLRECEIDVRHANQLRLVDGKGSLSFGKVRKGRRSKIRMFTIRNAGDAPLTGIRLMPKGRGARHFKIGRLPKSALAPGQSMRFPVRFKPKGKGRAKAALRIHSNDRDEGVFDISLRGVGKAK